MTARPGHRLRRSRGAGHRGPGADHDARSGGHPARGAAPGLCAPPVHPRSRADRGCGPPGGDRGHWVVHAGQSAPEARGARHRPRAVGAIRGAGADLEVGPRTPPLGARPRGGRGGADGRRPGAARRLQSQAPRRPLRRLQGHRGVGGEAAPGRGGRGAERGAVRSHAGGWAPAAGPLTGRPRVGAMSSPGSRQRDCTTWRPHTGPAAGPRRAAPALVSPDQAGGVPRAARRPDGTTTLGRERSRWSGLGERRQTGRARCVPHSASRGGFYLDTAETAGSRVIRSVINKCVY